MNLKELEQIRAAVFSELVSLAYGRVGAEPDDSVIANCWREAKRAAAVVARCEAGDDVSPPPPIDADALACADEHYSALSDKLAAGELACHHRDHTAEEPRPADVLVYALADVKDASAGGRLRPLCQRHHQGLLGTPHRPLIKLDLGDAARPIYLFDAGRDAVCWNPYHDHDAEPREPFEWRQISRPDGSFIRCLTCRDCAARANNGHVLANDNIPPREVYKSESELVEAT